MNTVRYSLLILGLSGFLTAQAQSTDEALVFINGAPVSVSDFDYAYRKDLKNASRPDNWGAADFLQAYISMKLTVEEAKAQGLDKLPSFTREYSGYLNQIEEPYLIDSITPDKIARGIYNRLKKNIAVSHIRINLPSGYILPKDTLALFNKISALRELAAKADETGFAKLAAEYSEDTLSLRQPMPGYLRWKTSMMMGFPFEQAMYNTPAGETSQVFRTKDGYHFLRVHAQRDDLGQINLAHILLAYPSSEPTQQQKDSVANLAQKVYKDLLAGENFDKLCMLYSGDMRTAAHGGDMGWFGVYRQLQPAFEQMVFGMETGDIVPPVEESYGYHIFKILNKIGLPSWEALRENILRNIDDGYWKSVMVRSKINRLSEEGYAYSLDSVAYALLKQAANAYVPTDSVFFETILPAENRVLLRTTGKDYTVGNFISFIEKAPYTYYTLSTDILSDKLNDFALYCLTEAKRRSLPARYADFRRLSEEFRDGILYFDLMDKEVWTKAQSDRDALQRLYAENPQKYKWNSPKYKGVLIHAKDKVILQQAQALAKAEKNVASIRKVLAERFNNDSVKNIIVERGLWAKGENPYVDRLVFGQKNDNEIIGYPAVGVTGKLIKAPENLDDAWGQVVADYQAILEQQWISKLRDKYKVVINREALDKYISNKTTIQ
jgi:peptidyl-prolyl cis-trans isomerase SurA